MSTISEVTEQARQLKLNVLPFKIIPCLNLGFVELLDWLGTDHDICESARVSYQEGTKKTSNDANLISRLMRKSHSSPFEQGILKFKIKAPIFVIIQIIRHRTARINSESARYSELKDEFYLPKLDRIKSQKTTDKQGSGDELDRETQEKIFEIMTLEQKDVKNNYQEYLAEGVARELARINMPLSTYMSFVWQIDVHNLFHFLGLRLDSHAQEEIQEYAKALYEFTKLIFPLCIQSFEEHKLHALKFSKTELEIIKTIINSNITKNDLIALSQNKLKGSRLNEFLNVFFD